MGKLATGIASGAAGTEALNIATYLDVALRGRPQSGLPAKAVEKMAEKAGIKPLTEEDETAKNRRSGLGALMGYATGLSVGVGYGLIRPLLNWMPLPLRAIAVGAGAMAASDIPSTKMGLTNPKEWGASGWAADVVPHLIYGMVTVLAFEKLYGDR